MAIANCRKPNLIVFIGLVLFLNVYPAEGKTLVGYQITAQHIYTSDCKSNDSPINKTIIIYDNTLVPPFTFHYTIAMQCTGVFLTQIQDQNGKWIDIGSGCLSNPGTRVCGVIGQPGGTITYDPIYVLSEKQFGQPNCY